MLLIRSNQITSPRFPHPIPQLPRLTQAGLHQLIPLANPTRVSQSDGPEAILLKLPPLLYLLCPIFAFR
jgi:hypothetical protein